MWQAGGMGPGPGFQLASWDGTSRALGTRILPVDTIQGPDKASHRPLAHEVGQQGQQRHPRSQKVDSHAAGTASHPAEHGQLWVLSVWPQQVMAWGPPPLQATFDGNPDRVALFLSQIIIHMDLYGWFYPSQWVMVVAMTTVLTSEAADWVTDLHSDYARELLDMELFLEALRARFEDGSWVLQAEGELLSL